MQLADMTVNQNGIQHLRDNVWSAFRVCPYSRIRIHGYVTRAQSLVTVFYFQFTLRFCSPTPSLALLFCGVSLMKPILHARNLIHLLKRQHKYTQENESENLTNQQHETLKTLLSAVNTMTTYYVLRSRKFLQKFTFSIVNRNRRQWTDRLNVHLIWPNVRFTGLLMLYLERYEVGHPKM